MSRMHYIASSRELPLGEFGVTKTKSSTKRKLAIHFTDVKLPEGVIPLEQIIDLSDISEDEIEVYSTYEDCAGIFVENIEPINEDIKKQFKNQFIYRFSPCWGNFFINEKLKSFDLQMYRANKKCIDKLFEYIRRNIHTNEEIEIFTCWYGEEGEERNESISIDLNAFNIDDNFELKEGQYLLVRI